MKKLFWIIPLMAAVAFWLIMSIKPRGVECDTTVEGIGMDRGKSGVELYRLGNDALMIEDRLLPFEDNYTTVTAEAELFRDRLVVTVRHDSAADETQITGNHARVTVELPEGHDVRQVNVTIISQQKEETVFEEYMASIEFYDGECEDVIIKVDYTALGEAFQTSFGDSYDVTENMVLAVDPDFEHPLRHGGGYGRGVGRWEYIYKVPVGTKKIYAKPPVVYITQEIEPIVLTPDGERNVFAVEGVLMDFNGKITVKVTGDGSGVMPFEPILTFGGKDYSCHSYQTSYGDNNIYQYSIFYYTVSKGASASEEADFDDLTLTIPRILAKADGAPEISTDADIELEIIDE